MVVPGSKSALRWRYGAMVLLLTLLLWTAALRLWSADARAFLPTLALGLALSVPLALIVAVAQRLRVPARGMLLAGATGLVAALHAALDMAWVHAPPFPGSAGASGSYKEILICFLLLYGVYVALIALLLGNLAGRERERLLADAHQAAQAAEIAALRLQLNPHFLFNTLNAISALIVTRRNDAAEQMTMRLSNFLRSSLESDPQREVTLDAEFASTETYLDIEAARFGERLCYRLDSPAQLLGALVPSFLFQPIVENAVRYGVAPARRPVTISMRARSEGDMLELTVADDAKDAAAPPPGIAMGPGLENVRRRLNAFYGAAASIETEAGKAGFIVTMRLPLRLAPAFDAPPYAAVAAE